MFGTNMEHPSRMLSYDSALKKWGSIKPIRGRDDQNTRPLARRGNDNLTIRQDTNGDVVVRLYHTDIVRYIAADGDGFNNTIELTPYPSAMTNRIMWSILGPHVNTHWSDRYPARVPNHITEVGGRYYNTPEYALIQPDERGWHLVGGQKPVEVPRLNRKEGNAALKVVGYPQFKLWLKTRIRLGFDPRGTSWRLAAFQWSASEIVKYLTEGETGWAEIAGRMSARADLDDELRAVRRAVYKSELCHDTLSYDHFESWSAVENALAAIRRAD